ncbi:MAG: hypothetical protein AAGN15_24060 [Cyanobacteria bacterium J06581_3]
MSPARLSEQLFFIAQQLLSRDLVYVTFHKHQTIKELAPLLFLLLPNPATQFYPGAIDQDADTLVALEGEQFNV